jgi:YihY family inner membrane protein
VTAVDRFDRIQRRHPAAGFPIAVVYKYFDDHGPYLAALIAYYGFMSLFPLLLLGSTILGFVLNGDPELQHRIIDSALGQFPVVGDQLQHPQHIGGGAGGLTIGILGALYGGLGVGQATQHAMNTAWHVPRNERPNPLKSRVRGLILLGIGGLGVLGTTAISTLWGSDVGGFGVPLKVTLIAASIVINAGLFMLAFRVATARKLSLTDIAPGAITAAVLWQVLQVVGVTYVRHVVAHASATNGVFAIVLGLVAFLYLAASVVVLCVEINVVHADKMHPRALLTPFTDDVDLDRGDVRSYTGQAKAQRNKGFEDIDVSFNAGGSGDRTDGD